MVVGFGMVWSKGWAGIHYDYATRKYWLSMKMGSVMISDDRRIG